MTLYDPYMDHSRGMQPETRDEVYDTCMSKVQGWLEPGLPNQTVPQQLSSLISDTCTNVTRLATVLYKDARPFDLDRIAPPELARPLYGVVSPFLIFLSLFFNGGLVAMLLFRQRMRTATGVLLGSMAILDGLTGLLQLPFLFYAYVLGQQVRYPDMEWCRVYWHVSKILPSLTHTASLWLAAMLALQRYLGVSRRETTKSSCVCCLTEKICGEKCRTRLVKVVCSIKGAAVVVVLCTLSAALLHLLQILFFRLQSVQLLSKQVMTPQGLDIIDTCSLRLKDQSLEVFHNYVYTWLRLLVAEFLPRVLIGCFNLRLVRVTRNSARYRRSLVQGHRASEKQESRSARRTTVMLVTLTTTALLTEMVVVVILLVEFLHVATSHSLIDQNLVNHLGVISNVLITAMLPANFIIYTYMCGYIPRLVRAVVHAPSCINRRRRGGGRGREGGGRGEGEGREDEEGEGKQREDSPAVFTVGSFGKSARETAGRNDDRYSQNSLDMSITV